MASSFLTRQANKQAKKIEQEYGASAYGGTASLRPSSVGTTTTRSAATATGGESTAPVSRASSFLTRQAQKSAAKIDRQYGTDAYGGSRWTALDKESGFQSWMDELNSFSQRVSEEYAGREGQYQNTEALGKYRDDTLASIGAMQNRGDIYRNYFRQNRSLYGDEAVDSILTALSEGGNYLEGVRNSLNSEYDYWSQWESEDAYNDYQRRANLDIDAAKAELADLEEQLEEAERERNTTRNIMVGTRYMTSKQIEDYGADRDEAQARYDDIQGRVSALQEDIEIAQQIAQARKYNSYRDAADWEENSQYRSTANGKDAVFNAWTGMYSETGFDDITYDYINRNEEAIGHQIVNDVATNASLLGVDNSFLRQMTDDEIATFNYIYATQGADPAYEYIAYLASDLNYRQRIESEAEWAAYANEHPIGSSVFSVLESPLKGLSYIGQIADYAEDGKIDQNAAYNKFSYLNGAIRNEVSSIVEEDWGEIGSSAYGIGMSLGDFIYSGLLTGALGGEALLGKAGAKVASNLTLGIMSSGAAADKVIEAKDRGLSDNQALALGTIAGAAEFVTEKFSLDALLEGKWERGALQYILKNAFTEGSEEVGSDLINLFADILISKDQSEWQMSIDAYISEGYSEGEAFGLAVADQAAQMGVDFIGGAISGGLLSGGYAGINAVANAAYNRYNQQLVQENDVKNTPVLETNPQEGPVQSQNEGEIDSSIPEATRQAVEMLVRGEEISGNQAARIAESEEAVALLSQLTGEEVNTDAPISRVKSDIRALASREGRTSGEAGVNSQATGHGAQTQVQTQERPAAMQAYDVRRMEQAAQAGGFGESGRRALLAAYDGSVDGTSFYTGFSSYYNAGLSGMDMGKVQSIYAQDLTEAQRYAAYTAGQNDAAASLQREKAGVQFVPVYGDEAGLVDNDNAKRVPQQTAALYNTLAKAAGVKIELVDEITTPDGGRGGNGLYIPSRNTIQISMDTEGAVGADGKLDAGAFAAVAAHEITHRIQDLAPEQYRAYRDYAMNAMAQAQGYGTTANLVEGKLREYAEGGVNLTAEQAMDEIAADFTRDMLQDAGLFKELAQEHRSVARRVLDALKDFIRRVKAAFSSRVAQDRAARSEYGVDMDTLEEAARLWQRAYDAATAQASGKSKSAAQADGAGRFSIRYDQDNNPYVVIEEDILAGVPRSEWVRTVKDNLRQKFPNGVTVGRNVIEIDKQSRREMTFSNYMQRLMRTDRQIFADKLRATNNADEILRAARNWVNEALLHPRRDAIIDFARGEVLMRIGSNDYAAQVIVGNRGGGNLLLYDIINLEQTEIQEKRTGTDYTQKPREGATGRQSAPASDDSISETGGDVNGRYSLKEYTDEERKSHAKEALEHFGQTYSWKETGYLTQDGKKIDFSGRHDGGPGGYRTVDHRDVSEALGDDYGGDDYSGAMVQFMSEGNIRISPESGGINLSVRPTKAQEQALEDFISKERGEVILDIDEPGGDTVVSVEYPRGTRASKVINDIRQYFEDGTQPYVSQVAQFRYSLKPTDSRGQELSEEQRRYFQGSKITDADGRLLILYHGTTAYGEITKFRRGRSGWLGPGIYLASRQADAKRYADAMGEGNGQLYELYANVTNPLVVTEGNPVPEILRVAYGRDSVYRSRSAKQGNDAQIITTADIKKLQSEGYDGIRWDFGGSTEVSVFSPEQIKRVDNLTPTSDPDIRRSIKGGDILRQNAALQEENSLLRERVEYWRSQTRRTERVTTDKKAVERAARELIRAYNSSLETAEIAGDLQSLYDYIASGRDGSDELTYTEARRRSNAIARKLVDSAAVLEDDAYRDYADLRSYLRSTPLSISTEDSHDIADFGDFRRRNFGRMTIRSGPTNIDQVYQEMSGMWPEFFDEMRESTPSDQLAHIAEVLDGIYRVTERNPFSGYFDAAVTDASNEIMERFFDLPQTRPTFADRQARKLDDAKAAGRRRLAEQRERSDARLAELRQQNRERVQRAIQRERETRARQIDRLKSRYAARDAAGRERRSARELRARISRHVADLSRRLLRPSDKQHIPEQLRTAVAAMLDAINLESVYTVDPETGRRRKGGNGDPTKRTEAFRALREQYEAISQGKTDFHGVLDPELAENLAEVIAMGDTRLAEMNTEQLGTVWKVLRAVEASITSANKLFGANRYAGVEELARGIRESSRGKRAKGNYGGPGMGRLTGFGDQLLNTDMLNALSFLHLFGEGGDALYHELQTARDNKTRIMERTVELVQEVIGKDSIQDLQRETHTFQVEGGEITLTTAQLMSLYELNKREQAQDHIYKGGLRPTAQERRVGRGRSAAENVAAVLGRLDAPPEGVRVTQGDVFSMLSTLSDREIEIADGLQAIMQGYLAEQGNRESMKVYGYRKFTEDHYFPINSDPHQVQTKIGDILEGGEGRPVSVAEWGSSKGTVKGANNGLLLGDIFDVFAQHAVDMSTYASHLGTLEDVNRVRNFTFRDSEGTRTGSMGDIIQRVAGNGGNAYLDKLLQDMSRGTARGGVAGLSRLTANYKAASVGLNLRVALQQPTSYARALAVMDARYLFDPRAMRRGGWEKALKYAPIARWKDWGNFEINQGRQFQNILFNTDSAMERARNASMKLAGAMDSATWGRLWNACELEIADTRPRLTRGSEAFYEAVAQRFTDVVDQTQVVDNVLGRSQFMRSSDNLAKMASSYMGEPTQSYNLLYRSYRDAIQEQDPAKRGQAIKRFGRTAAALTFSMFLNAIAQSIWDGVRDDEDRDEKYWERVLRHILPNFAQNANPLGMVPYFRDILSAVQGYDVARMDMEAVTGLITAWQNMQKALDGEGRYTVAGASINLAAELARILGIPAATVKRDLEAIARSIGVETENWYFQYQIERALNSVGYSGNRTEFYNIAFGALADGDLETYQLITADLMEQGVKGSTIENAMRVRLEAAQNEDPDFSMSQEAQDLIGYRAQYAPETEAESGGFSVDDLPPAQRQSYAALRAQRYREIADDVEASRGFASLPQEVKDRALDSAERLAEATALSSATDGAQPVATQWMLWATGGDDYGVDEAEAVLFKTAYDMAESDKDEDGKTISGSKKENTLEIAGALLPDLTDRELEYLMANYWAPEDEGLKALKENKFVG